MIRLVAVALALLGPLAAQAASAQDDDRLEWLADYDEALALAKETGKPILLEFRCAP